MSTEQQLYKLGREINPENMDIPSLNKQTDYNIFFRGIFDVYGQINTKTVLNSELICEIYVSANFTSILIDKIKYVYDLAIETSRDITILKNYNAMDFLNYIYADSDARYRNNLLYDKYIKWVTFGFETNIIPRCKFVASDDLAIHPIKTRSSDVGYDLTIVKLFKTLGKNTFMFDTCIKVSPDFGYYTMIVPRSSLVKSGYILSNSIGIIDGTYTGSLKIVLTKVDDSFPDLTLPFKCCQLIMHRHIHYEMVMETEELSITSRGEGGFGSTS